MANSYASPVEWPEALARIDASVLASTSLEEAAGATVKLLRQAFDSTVLARIYYTVPYAKLPRAEKAFVDALAATTAQRIHDDTLVLVLLGTEGTESAWCDRRQSRGHLAIPLVSAAFVEGIPMLARLFQELGVELDAFDRAPELNVRRLVGGFNGVFFVDEARAARDAQARLIIPAEDFVRDARVESVFGMGGVYPDGSLVAAVVFTRERLTRSAIEPLKNLISTFKAETFGLVRTKRIFAI